MSRVTGSDFNLLYEAVALAIDRKMREIDLGIDTLAPKLDLGAVAVCLYMYMKHRNRLCHRIFPRMFRAMTPGLESSRRHVFRK